MKKIIELTEKHAASAKALISAVKQAFPPGSIVRAKITGGENGTWIEAEVLESLWDSERYPHQILVRNTRTGKIRKVSVHPRHGNSVELVLAQNAGADGRGANGKPMPETE